jgi:hypothetical protein
VGRPIHDRKCAGCVKDRQSVVSRTMGLIVSVPLPFPLLIDARVASHEIGRVCQEKWTEGAMVKSR